jgi:3-oxoacyl-[acyl-carrier-protein] synthase-3
MVPEIRTVVSGTGSFLPEKILTNQDFERLVDTTDEWITTRTGIKSRHIAEPGMTTSDMAAAAGKRALEAAGVDPKDVELIIVATFTGDRPLPATACFVQTKLGATKAGAFDLSAACSGFIYALATGWGYIRSGIYKNVLVIGADLLSAFTDYTDRSSCILFGDGAGAVLLQADKTGTERGILNCALGADGAGADLMTIPAGGTELRTSEETLRKRQHYISVHGREVFKFAATKMQELVRDSLKTCKLTIDDVKLVVPHQVNTRILDFAAEKLNLPKEKMYVNIERVANTSAASIPIALDEAARGGYFQRGDVIVLVAFGGGLTWASMVLRW